MGRNHNFSIAEWTSGLTLAPNTGTIGEMVRIQCLEHTKNDINLPVIPVEGKTIFEGGAKRTVIMRLLLIDP